MPPCVCIPFLKHSGSAHHSPVSCDLNLESDSDDSNQDKDGSSGGVGHKKKKVKNKKNFSFRHASEHQQQTVGKDDYIPQDVSAQTEAPDARIEDHRCIQ